MRFLPGLLVILPKVLPRNPSDRIILDNCALLKFKFVYKLLAKAFLILVLSFAARSN